MLDISTPPPPPPKSDSIPKACDPATNQALSEAKSRMAPQPIPSAYQTIEEILNDRQNWEICNCPLCGTEGDESDIAHRLARSNYTKCRACNLVYLNPRLNQEAMRRVYESSGYFEGSESNLGYQSYSSQDDCYARTFRRRLERVLMFQRPGRSLDIGCGTGILVEEAQKLGYESHGIDVSGHGLSSRLVSLGERFKQGTIEEVRYPDNHFDLITLCDVIEHIYDPRSFAEGVRRIVSPGGIVALATPNYAALMRKVFGERNVSFKIPEHVTYYSTETLCRAMGDGFELIESRPTGQVCTLEFLRSRLARVAPPLALPLRLLGGFMDLNKPSLFVYSGSIFALFRKR
jgi:2-polyprenyl-3-methyl-5-hydroxy-6-metoxy-1,4-benzoquinol methylase